MCELYFKLYLLKFYFYLSLRLVVLCVFKVPYVFVSLMQFAFSVACVMLPVGLLNI